jgi:hypothetical protein
MANINVTVKNGLFSIALDQWEWTGLEANNHVIPQQPGATQFEYSQATAGEVNFTATSSNEIKILNPDSTIELEGPLNAPYTYQLTLKYTSTASGVQLKGTLNTITSKVSGAKASPQPFSQGNMTGHFQVEAVAHTSGSITVTYETEGNPTYLAGVTDLVIGNLVNPATGVWEFTPNPMSNPWTWSPDGNNNVAFGLMGQYNETGTAETALSKVVIDPNQIEGGSTVVVKLCTAGVDGHDGNTLLRFKSVTVNGKVNPSQAYVDQWGTSKSQPASTFYGMAAAVNA